VWAGAHRPVVDRITGISNLWGPELRQSRIAAPFKTRCDATQRDVNSVHVVIGSDIARNPWMAPRAKESADGALGKERAIAHFVPFFGVFGEQPGTPCEIPKIVVSRSAPCSQSSERDIKIDQPGLMRPHQGLASGATPGFHFPRTAQWSHRRIISQGTGTLTRAIILRPTRSRTFCRPKQSIRFVPSRQVRLI